MIRERPILGESHVDFLGESEGSLSPPQDSFPDAGEAINDFWSMSGNFIHRHHVEPRVKTLLAERRIIPFSTKIFDVSRTTQTWMLCKKAASMTFGILMGQEICLILGQVSLNHHEDHIAEKGYNSLQHYNLVHKFIPMPQAMNSRSKGSSG